MYKLSHQVSDSRMKNLQRHIKLDDVQQNSSLDSPESLKLLEGVASGAAFTTAIGVGVFYILPSVLVCVTGALFYVWVERNYVLARRENRTGALQLYWCRRMFRKFYFAALLFALANVAVNWYLGLPLYKKPLHSLLERRLRFFFTEIPRTTTLFSLAYMPPDERKELDRLVLLRTERSMAEWSFSLIGYTSKALFAWAFFGLGSRGFKAYKKTFRQQ
jgi:hypothetical protein